MSQQVTTTVLSNVICFQLDVSIWSARKKLKPEDLQLDPAQIPPSEIAALGSKKICDPELLKPFLRIKRRAERCLEEGGVRFLGGYALPEALIKAKAKEVGEFKEEFEKYKSEFLVDYDQRFEAWVAAHPRYESAIRASAMSASQVSDRLSFQWSAFRISSPSTEETDEVNSGLVSQTSTLKDQLIREISADAQTLSELINKRGDATKRTLRPVVAVRKKLAGLAFLDSSINGIVALIDDVLRMMPISGVIQGVELTTLKGLLGMLGDVNSITKVGKRIVGGEIPTHLLEAELKLESQASEDELNTLIENATPPAAPEAVKPALAPIMPRVAPQAPSVQKVIRTAIPAVRAPIKPAVPKLPIKRQSAI